MINESEWNRMISEELYSPWKVGGDSWSKVHVAQKAFNESEFWHDRTALNSLRECFGSAPDDMVLTPPVYFDHGDRTTGGSRTFFITPDCFEEKNYEAFLDRYLEIVPGGAFGLGKADLIEDPDLKKFFGY